MFNIVNWININKYKYKFIHFQFFGSYFKIVFVSMVSQQSVRKK